MRPFKPFTLRARFWQFLYHAFDIPAKGFDYLANWAYGHLYRERSH